ncbi:hydantoinase B/oxoprolinase family protein [Neorhizobium vignae]|uniref:hydantoinase B/oxoprolinase family protein n=1 Tax=Neorhizobium vignae TaxID=690585 RepID=UPI000562BDE6|nr:hydantoinase B/oxoprolinase family protein [Neorhizobium vignae]
MQQHVKPTREFDAIEMEVYSNRFMSITDEMGLSLVRSSFSTNIKERKDCSVGLFDGKGRLVVQASHIPVHLGSLQGGVAAVLENYRLEDIKPGDAFICNDPYLAGGSHTPDISILTPVFYQGRLCFFAANLGHHSDVGGGVPGSCDPSQTSIFAEGLRIPVLKIAREGVLDEQIVKLISTNSRDPLERILDLKVQIATNEIGQRKLVALADQFGIATVEEAIDDLIAYSESRLRKRIKEMPDGVYKGEAFIDGDGIGFDPCRIQVAINVKGEGITFDFTGTDSQARGAVNIPKTALDATCYYTIKALLDPSLPPNEGMASPVTIIAEEGTLVRPKFPAAVGIRSTSCQRVVRAIFQAFADVLPREKVFASSADMNATMIFFGPHKTREGSFVYLETVGGGAGASLDHDGMNGIQVHITNTSNLPAEALEIEYPLMVRRYALADGSGGKGHTAGGMGIVREVVAMTDGIRANASCEGLRTPADGVFGGGQGEVARLKFGTADGTVTEYDISITNIPMNRGDSLFLQTPGGGGFGRAPELIGE